MDIDWNGPNIIRQNGRYYAHYFYIVPKTAIPKKFIEIRNKCSTLEFKCNNLRDNPDQLMFTWIRKITKQDRTNFLNETDSLRVNGNDIYQEVSNKNNGMIWTNQKKREAEWKNWYQEHLNQLIKHNDSVTDIEQFQSDTRLECQDKLLPYQVSHAKNLLYSQIKYGRSLDASDTGIGKTYIILAICRQLNLKPIIICPLSVIPSWKEALKYFDYDDYFVSNYEKYRTGSVEFLDKLDNYEKSDFFPKYFYKWNLDVDNHLLIFDECQRIKNSKTMNYAFFWWACHQKYKIHCLSATCADKLEYCFPIAYCLGLCPDFGQFKKKYMTEPNFQYFGYEVNVDGKLVFNPRYLGDKSNFKKNNFNLEKLHRDIFPSHGNRLKIEQLGDQFPDNLIEAKTYMMENSHLIQESYSIIKLNYLNKRLNSEHNKLKLQNYTEEQSNIIKENISKIQEEIDKLDLDDWQFDRSNMLNDIHQERIKIETLKCDTMFKLAMDFYNEGKSVAIFINFLDSLEKLKSSFEKANIDVSMICGKQTNKQRKIDIDAFQRNERRIIISTIQSGGVGISLHDTDGKHPRISLISSGWSAQDLIQTLGRIHRAGSKSKCQQYIVFCSDTIEDEICQCVRQKINVINMLNDGDLGKKDILS